MFIKRLLAIVIALILLLQLTACNTSSSHGDISSLITSSEEIRTNDITVSNSQNTDAPQQDDKDTIYTDDTPSNDTNTQDKDNTKHDNKENEINTSSSVNNYQNNITDESQSDNTSSNKNQTADNIQQSNDQDEINTDNTVTSCNHGTDDPYINISKSEFYATYTIACCNQDAINRSKHGFLSGSLKVPDQYAVEADTRPKSNDKFIRNTTTLYVDNGNTYIVMDCKGNEVMRIHKAGGYITLEEVAAYMYAFGGNGTTPANYSSRKSTKPNNSPWGEYLRVNHSYFKGDTYKYPYEPELPDISGCGGSLQYYEMDIGTTGTTTPGYAPKPYIQGNKINRGAARIVYARQDNNGNGMYETNEVYVFYTHNHYNDFREYLNYYGGWGEMFGNVTGGGEYSSKTNANPTPYVYTDYADFLQ